MVDKLFPTLKYSGIIAIALLTANMVQANPTEYVFSAPPEIDNELVEIPTSETDYPLYECNNEHEQTETAIDSHDCECIDCDNQAQDAESNEQFTSQNKQNRE